jgi:hypothetical protein
MCPLHVICPRNVAAYCVSDGVACLITVRDMHCHLFSKQNTLLGLSACTSGSLQLIVLYRPNALQAQDSLLYLVAPKTEQRYGSLLLPVRRLQLSVSGFVRSVCAPETIQLTV